MDDFSKDATNELANNNSSSSNSDEHEASKTLEDQPSTDEHQTTTTTSTAAAAVVTSVTKAIEAPDTSQQLDVTANYDDDDEDEEEEERGTGEGGEGGKLETTTDTDRRPPQTDDSVCGGSALDSTTAVDVDLESTVVEEETVKTERASSAMDVSMNDTQTTNVDESDGVEAVQATTTASIENNNDAVAVAMTTVATAASGGDEEKAAAVKTEPSSVNEDKTPIEAPVKANGTANASNPASGNTSTSSNHVPPSTTTTQPTSITSILNNSANKAQTAYLAHNGRIRKVAASNLVFKEENIQTYTDANGIIYKISGTLTNLLSNLTDHWSRSFLLLSPLQITSTWTPTNRTSRSPSAVSSTSRW